MKAPRGRSRRHRPPVPKPPLRTRLAAALVGAAAGAFAVLGTWAKAERSGTGDFPPWAWWAAGVLCAVAGAAAGFALGDKLLGPKAGREAFEERLRRRREDRP